MKIVIKQIENINNTLFNIYDSKYILPIAIRINGSYYQISSFNDKTDEFVYYGEKSVEEAINFVVDLIGHISYRILIKVYEICEVLKADTNKINIFQIYNIKGKQAFETLNKSLNLPSALLDFIDKKDIPLKITALITSQNENIINFINGAVICNEYSLQNFRKFVEKVCDFKEIIPESYNKGFTFPEVKSKTHREIDDNYNKLISEFQNIKINNLDNFETPKLNISFDINNIKDYENIIKLLETNTLHIKLFYKILEKYGLK